MITSKLELKEYLQKDKLALGINRKKPKIFGDEIWKFQIYLRKHEYYLNTGKGKLRLLWCKYRQHKLGIKLGFSIPCNVFGGGLRINHYGFLVVNPAAKIGEFCNIHQGVNIGVSTDGLAPTIGNNVWIGPGAKLFGGITIGNDCMIGANAVVNKTYADDGLVLAGIPARIISNNGNYYKIL